VVEDAQEEHESNVPSVAVDVLAARRGVRLRVQRLVGEEKAVLAVVSQERVDGQDA
jgi:hypothetical protein